MAFAVSDSSGTTGSSRQLRGVGRDVGATGVTLGPADGVGQAVEVARKVGGGMGVTDGLGVREAGAMLETGAALTG